MGDEDGNEDTHRKLEKINPTEASSEDSSATCTPSKFTYKAYFFLFFSAIGSSIPYLTLYFKQLGLTAGHAGILLGLRLFTEFIGSPLWGMVGDRFRKRKIILFASLVSFTAGTLLLMAVQPQNQTCIETMANKTEIKSLIFTSGRMELGSDKQSYNGKEIKSEIIEALTDQGVTNQQFQNHSSRPVLIRNVDESEITKIFIIIFVIIFTGQIIGSVVYTMPDALVVGFLKENVTTAFGSFRMWGEVGVALASFIVGGVINFYQSEVCGETVKNYFISFYFFAGFMALAIFTVAFMEVTYPDQETSTDVNLLPLVKELLKFHNAIFIIVACYLGILIGLHEYFGLWYLDDLGAEPYMLGIASGIRYTIALLGYVLSGVIMNKFGLVCTIAICLALYGAVYMGLAFVLNPWLGVALFSAQGILYGVSWSACVVFGATVSLRVGFYSATQGFVGGCHWGLGVGSGIVISGLLINWVGVARTYFIYSLTSLVVLVLFLSTHLFVRFREGKDDSEEHYKLVPTSEEDAEPKK
ncbi:major facilitator superfamily domain-containing protein 6-like [Oculina patagonica]